MRISELQKYMQDMRKGRPNPGIGFDDIEALIDIAKCTETLVHNFEALQQDKMKNYMFDFTPNMKSCREALEELEK